MSSSGHIILFQRVFQIDEEIIFLLSSFFRIGTLVAAIGVLWKDLINIVKRPFSRLPIYILIASAPYIVMALILNDYIKSMLITGSILGFGFIITGIILLIGETVNLTHRNIESMKIRHILTIGIVQALSVFPIISRSATAISGGFSQDVDRRFTARLVFLMAIPAILTDLILNRESLSLAMQTPNLMPMLISGTIAATIVGCLAINSASRFISKGRLNKYAYYSILIGILVLVDNFYIYFIF